MLLELLRRDTSLALRACRRNPTYALAAAATMALAVATATSIFAVVDATLIRPLPFADPDRLVAIGVQMPGPGGRDTQYVPTETEIVRWRDATTTLTGIEGF